MGNAGLVQLEQSIDIQTDQGAGLGLEAMAWVFKALSDPARLKILRFLAQPFGCCNSDGVCACDLETLTGLSQPTVSHHMRCLQSAGLVRHEKRGKWMYYQLDPQGFKLARGFVNALNCC